MKHQLDEERKLLGLLLPLCEQYWKKEEDRLFIQSQLQILLLKTLTGELKQEVKAKILYYLVEETPYLAPLALMALASCQNHRLLRV